VVHLENYTNKSLSYSITCSETVKQRIQKNWHNVQAAEYLEIALLKSSDVITAERARGWFIHSGYNVV